MMNHKEYTYKLFGLEGHVGIVTGASRGIGAGIAAVLAEAGATVYNFSRRPAEKETEGVRFLSADLLDRAACERAVEEVVAREGRLDFLINNAGITHKQRAEEFDAERYRAVMDTDLDAVFALCQICYPHLKKSEHIGRIVSISSMGAHLGFGGVTPYCMAKSGLLGLTRGLATEWAHDNILVNSVAPGWVLTELNNAMYAENPDRKEAARRKIALDRFAEPEDVGHMVLFLLGRGASYLTGQDFAVDGGALGFGY